MSISHSTICQAEEHAVVERSIEDRDTSNIKMTSKGCRDGTGLQSIATYKVAVITIHT